MPSLYFHWKRWRAQLWPSNHRLSTLNIVFMVRKVAFPNCLHVNTCQHCSLRTGSRSAGPLTSDLWPLWLSQLEDRWVERLLGELWRRLSAAPGGVRLPWCLWAPCGGRRCLRHLRWGPAHPADLQHAQMCRVSSDRMERCKCFFFFSITFSSVGGDRETICVDY